jgi:cytochrome c-type biogenesis protein CcsB
MKMFFSLLGSMKTMAVLMLTFAFAIGWATIIENDYGTTTARADVYDALWFDVLIGVLALNLFLNIIHFAIKKRPFAFLFHFAFFVMLLGASLTHFLGYEGSMHIRNGSESSTIVSTVPYMNISVSNGSKEIHNAQMKYLSKRGSNSYEKTLELDGKKVEVKLVQYIPDVIQELTEDANGVSIADMMVTKNGQGQSVQLSPGEFFNADGVVIDFGSHQNFTKPVIELSVKDGKLYMSHPMALHYMHMSDRSTGMLPPAKEALLDTRTLYTAGSDNFVLRQFYLHAKTKLASNPHAKARDPQMDALRFEVSSGGVSKKVLVYGQAGMLGDPTTVDINGLQVGVAYGSKTITIPFAIKLDQFILKRYPGSMSPSSYASQVTVVDPKNNVTIPFNIHMNHILEYRGFKFFQSSYDRDLQGTILSVNHDPGTDVTYLGYFLLGLGLFGSLFVKNGRFAQLSRIAKEASAKKSALAAALLAVIFANPHLHAQQVNPIIKSVQSFNKASADKFGDLIVQGNNGRMEPLNTLANAILNKLYRSDTILGLNANQVILGMLMRPESWREIKMIRTSNKEINKILGIAPDSKYASFSQFFTSPNSMSGYKLAPYVDAAMRKDPKRRGVYDRDFIKVDERVNVAYMVYTGSIFKIWPKPNDPNQKWYDTISALKDFSPQNRDKVHDLAMAYFTSIDNALQTGDWSQANKALANITDYQKFYGAAVYPAKSRIQVEILYNKLNIFERLWPLYFFVGFALLILSFVKILRPAFQLNIFSKGAMALLILFFIAHTAGLAMRWYISGHAPWSDGFESMIYIAWATVLAGFIFSRHSPITFAATSILAGLILFVAHLSWMDPQITNLVPVLNSYWLDIHVSMITASYGFLGLGALLGFITILLFIFKTGKNSEHINLSVIELNAINEMSLMIGLAMLTVGTFLGGVWANQSWGHYWGWDPKEVWALVSILVYAVVMHLRFIKPIYNSFNYSVISLIAFTSVLMTYFGVNYYLGGLHSYAKGDPVPIPDFVPIAYSIVFLTIAFAGMRDVIFNPQNTKNNLVWIILLAIAELGIIYETVVSGKSIYVLISCIGVELLLLYGGFWMINGISKKKPATALKK